MLIALSRKTWFNLLGNKALVQEPAQAQAQLIITRVRDEVIDQGFRLSSRELGWLECLSKRSRELFWISTPE